MADEKLLANLFDILVLLEQSATDKNQHIPGYIAAARYQAAQGFRMETATALWTFKDGLMCGKRRNHAQHGLSPRFLHIEFAVAQTGIALRSESNHRYPGKQAGRPGLLTKPLQTPVQRRQSCRTGVYAVFFKPCRSNSALTCPASIRTPVRRVIACANWPKPASGRRINSTSTKTAISAGSWILSVF